MKKKNVNWFIEQDKKKEAAGNKKDNKAKSTKRESDYRQINNAPILQVKISPALEEEHYNEALAFAQKVSDPNSEDMMTVHLNMRGELEFNREQDEEFAKLWREKKLMLLIAFPKNWKTMPLKAYDEDDDEIIELADDVDRFDYLYEMGMSISD